MDEALHDTDISSEVLKQRRVRFWTCHWQFRYWRADINQEWAPLRSSGSNSFHKRGVSVGDTVYIISLSEGQLYLGGRMVVQRIVSRAEAVRLLNSDNLYDAEVDAEESGTLLHLHRRLAPALTKQLRFVSSAGPKRPLFVSQTELDNQTTRGVREITAESAALLDRIIDATDGLRRAGQLITVTEKLIRDGSSEVSDDVKMTLAERIVSAVREFVGSNLNAEFTREEVRRHAGVEREEWVASWSPIFQGMREDQPGGAPQVSARFGGVFRRIRHGVHTLTEHGQSLVRSTNHVATAPQAHDLHAPSTERVLTTLSRIIRDTRVAAYVKGLHRHECQICGQTIVLADGSRYAEAHHIQPLGAPHDGPDISENVICLCPNHHASCDLGAIRLEIGDLRFADGHTVGSDFIEYHNRSIYGH